MKKQILSLMIGAAVLTVSPVFAARIDDDKPNRSRLKPQNNQLVYNNNHSCCISRNTEEELRTLKSSAENKDIDAQKRLGALYSTGFKKIAPTNPTFHENFEGYDAAHGDETAFINTQDLIHVTDSTMEESDSVNQQPPKDLLLVQYFFSHPK